MQKISSRHWELIRKGIVLSPIRTAPIQIKRHATAAKGGERSTK